MTLEDVLQEAIVKVESAMVTVGGLVRENEDIITEPGPAKMLEGYNLLCSAFRKLNSSMEEFKSGSD